MNLLCNIVTILPLYLRWLLASLMKIRVRGPEGQTTIYLSAAATVDDLLANIVKSTSIQSPEIKYGYPPKSLRLDELDPSIELLNAGINLDGEQITVSQSHGKPEPSQPGPRTEPPENPNLGIPPITDGSPSKPTTNASIFLNSNTSDLEPPEIPLPSYESTLLLRIMPDDNSCLFRAFGSAFFGVMDNMTELRSIIAQHIQEDPVRYSTAVLDKSPDDYCRWIQTENAWGGAIELDILSRHFEVEICSIDVQSLRVDRFQEGVPNRCILVYSGVHYDTIALAPADSPYDRASAPPEFDTKIFDARDEVILEKALELCSILQKKHYFTDTAGFHVKCNICGSVLMGEKGAIEHAKETGHYDFGEAQ